MILKEIQLEEDKTITEIMDEFQLSPTTHILLAVNGQVFHPTEIMDRKLGKGDKVMLISPMGGG